MLILVGILLVGGGAAGFYFWNNRTPSKDDKPIEKEKQLAQGGSPPSNDKERESEKNPKTQISTQPNNDRKELIAKSKQIPPDKPAKQSGDIKNPPSPVQEPKQVPEEKKSAKPKPVVPTVAYSEDFRAVEVGDRPKGWDSDNSVALFKGNDGRPYLHASKEGNHKLTTPSLGLRGDFYVECEFEMGPGQLLEMTLIGQDGAPSLPIKFDAGGGGNPADVHFPESAVNHVSGVDGLSTTRLRLERARDIYRVGLNGKTCHARRLQGFKDFSAIQFTFPGEPQIAKLFGVRSGPYSSQSPQAKATIPKADDAFRLGFREDFKKVVPGDLPAGWEGDDAVAVRQDGARPRLEGAQEGNLSVKLPPVHIHGDFFLECELELAPYQTLETTLVGKDGAPSLSIKVDPGGGGSNSTVYFPDGSSDKVPQTAGMAVPFRIERKDEVYRISLNNKLAHAGRFEAAGDFERVQLTFTGGTVSAKVYSIRLGPLGSK